MTMTQPSTLYVFSIHPRTRTTSPFPSHLLLARKAFRLILLPPFTYYCQRVQYLNIVASVDPPLTFLHSIGCLGRHMLVMPYNEKWRKMRVAIHPEMTQTKVLQSYVPLEEAETRIALYKIAQDPASASRYMRQIVGNVTLRSQCLRPFSIIIIKHD